MSETTEKTYEVTLSGELLAWVESELEQGPCSTVGDYLRWLIQRDLSEVASLVEAGRASGPSGEDFKQVMAEIRAKWSDEAA